MDRPALDGGLVVGAGAPTLHHQAQSAERERKEGAANHPLVQAVLAKFPGAQIVNVVDRSEKTAEERRTAILGDADSALAGHDPDGDDDL